MTKIERTRAMIGSGIIACSVAALFWWGTYFEVFGSDIDWLGRPEQLGLPLFVVIGAFGAGFIIGGSRSGVRASLWTAGIFVAAAAIGTVRPAI